MPMFLTATADAAAAPAAMGPIGLVVQLVLMVAVFYFILIRPQKKKDKAFKELLASLEVGDEVTTIGGMYGKVAKIKDEKVVIECGTVEKTKIYLYKWGIKEVKQKEKA